MNFKNMEATEVSQLLIKQLNNLYFINDSEGQSILSGQGPETHSFPEL